MSGMKATAKSIASVCALAVGLLLFDTIADTAGCDDSKTATEAVCHVCSCGAHLFSQSSPEAVMVLTQTPFAAYQSSAYVFLLPQSIFHPPRLAA
jgi:hypothetical protein